MHTVGSFDLAPVYLDLDLDREEEDRDEELECLPLRRPPLLLLLRLERDRLLDLLDDDDELRLLQETIIDAAIELWSLCKFVP